MKKIAYLLTATLLLATPAFAALSPLNQSLSEVCHLCNRKELNQYLPQNEPIQEIIRDENGFEVLTENYRLQVDLDYVPNSTPGPKRYELNFHTPEKRED